MLVCAKFAVGAVVKQWFNYRPESLQRRAESGQRRPISGRKITAEVYSVLEPVDYKGGAGFENFQPPWRLKNCSVFEMRLDFSKQIEFESASRRLKERKLIGC